MIFLTKSMSRRVEKMFSNDTKSLDFKICQSPSSRVKSRWLTVFGRGTKIMPDTLIIFQIPSEDPLWSTGQGVWLPNGSSTVRILCSANAFELKRFEYQEPTTPGESCGSSTRLVPLNNCLQLMSQLACLKCKEDWQLLVSGVWQSFLVRKWPWQ